MDAEPLHVDISGTGPPLVLLHGFTLDLHSWDDNLPALAAHHRVVRYDQRGMGRSPLPAHGPVSHVDDLVGLLDELGIERACIAGLSVGASYALELAVAHPERVERLVLVSPSGVAAYPFSAPILEGLRALKELAPVDLDRARARWLELGWFRTAMASPELAPRIRSWIAAYAGTHWLVEVPVKRLEPPAIERLDAVRAPTLVLLGALDTPYNHALATHLASHIAGARLHTVPNAGHLLNLEGQEAFERALLDFTAGTDRPGSRRR